MTTEELITAQFYAWEKRGRGWQIWSHPVEPEPPFQPFPGYYLPTQDDGRRPGAISSWVEKLHGRQELPEPDIDLALALDYYRQTEPASFFDYSPLIVIQVSLPTAVKTIPETAERFLSSLRTSAMPISFEVIGLSDTIVMQFACRETDSELLRSNLRAYFPDSRLKETDDFLKNSWLRCDSDPDSAVIVDFGLSHEFVIPLHTSNISIDPLIGIVGSLSDVKDNEATVLQVLFQATQHEWGNSAIAAATDLAGNSIFVNSPQMAKLLRQKLSYPLFAAVFRVGAISGNKKRSWELVKRLGSALISVFLGTDSADANELIPLSNEGYDDAVHEEDLLSRQTHRSGMILNSAELLPLVHIPSPAVRSEKFQLESQITKPAPQIAINDPAIDSTVVALGENSHEGVTQTVFLTNEQRSRHIHIIGSTGSGKSTLMLHMIRQDMEIGNGLCVLDPHGDLIDEIVARVPESRLDDVILFDPSDAEYPVGFNILQANSELEKTLLSSDLVATFRRMSTSWGDVMDSVLANAILALVESDRGGTLFDLKRFLVERRFRDEFLETVNDDAIRYFWHHEFPMIASKPQASILIRLDTFLRQKLIRNIVCQNETKLNFRRIMDERKILLIKLSQGLIGQENAYLLGTLFVSKIYQTALSRQETDHRPYCSLYLDEFQHFITPSMENILSGSRKYNLGLVLSHQEFRQLQSRSQEVASSILSNCYTRVCFRLGDNDVERFAGSFSFFDAKALQNLGVGEAVARVERADYDFNLSVTPVPAVPRETVTSRAQSIRENSRTLLARIRSDVEAEISTSRPEKATEKEEKREPVTKDRKAAETATTETPASSLTRQRSQKEVSGEHRYIQGIIKRIGEDFGFIATIEKQVFGGIGKIDVALEREDIRIACEVANTNTTEYEVQNIRKCLASGFDRMVVISADRRHLENIRKRAELVLSPVHLSRVHFLEPENFHLFLESIPTIRPEVGKEPVKIKGYKVRVSVKEISPSEASAKRNVIRDLVSRVMRRRKRSEHE